MNRYILVTRFDFGLIKVWAKFRRVDIQIVPDEEVPFSISIKRAMYTLADLPVKTIVLRVSETGYERLKPFIRDL